MKKLISLFSIVLLFNIVAISQPVQQDIDDYVNCRKTAEKRDCQDFVGNMLNKYWGITDYKFINYYEMFDDIKINENFSEIKQEGIDAKTDAGHCVLAFYTKEKYTTVLIANDDGSWVDFRVGKNFDRASLRQKYPYSKDWWPDVKYFSSKAKIKKK